MQYKINIFAGGILDSGSPPGLGVPIMVLWTPPITNGLLGIFWCRQAPKNGKSSPAGEAPEKKWASESSSGGHNGKKVFEIMAIMWPLGWQVWFVQNPVFRMIFNFLGGDRQMYPDSARKPPSLHPRTLTSLTLTWWK